jgi:aminodeoxyfutalosine deaminase
VHLEATVRPETLLEIARRNDFPLPADTAAGIRDLYRFRDFDHFIEVWILTTNALHTADDFRQVVVDYAAEARRHGAVYVELGRRATKYKDRGIVGIGLGGEEALYPPEKFTDVFALVRDEGFGSVPHAGEVAGPESVRGALDSLHADRIRHGIRAVEDPELLEELAERRVVLDVTPLSNVRTGVVGSLEEHPLPELVAAGIPCTVSTDDPEMFDTDLTREYDAVLSIGMDPQTLYEAGVEGALCSDASRARLREIGEAYDWSAISGAPISPRARQRFSK